MFPHRLVSSQIGNGTSKSILRPGREDRAEVKRGRQNPDDGGGLVVERHRLSDNSGIRRKATSPKPVAQQRGSFAVPNAFIVYKPSADYGADPEEVEKVLRYADPSETLGFTAAGEGVAAGIEKCEVGSEVFEGLIHLAPVGVVSDLCRNPGQTGFRGRPGHSRFSGAACDPNQPVRL